MNQANKHKIRKTYPKNFPENIEALERDGWKCVRCGEEEDIIVHHIDGSRRLGLNRMNRSLDNLMTLCWTCHSKEHGNRVIDIDEMLNLKRSGKTLKEVGELFGVSRQRIHQIMNKQLALDKITQIRNNVGISISKQSKTNEKTVQHNPRRDRLPPTTHGKQITQQPNKMSLLIMEKKIRHHLSFHVDEKMHNDIRRLAYKDKRLKAAEARQLIKEAIQNRKEETK